MRRAYRWLFEPVEMTTTRGFAILSIVGSILLVVDTVIIVVTR